MDADMAVLTDLINRMENGEHIKPDTDEEKLCFQLITNQRLRPCWRSYQRFYYYQKIHAQ